MDTIIKTKKIGENAVYWQPINEVNKNYKDVINSWKNGFFAFREEDSNNEGLRPPQIGAIHAGLGYEKSDHSESATIVMPTGTGKTETILSLVVAGKFPLTLVIVPSDALRTQIQNKFINLGLLRKLKLVSSDFENPFVTTINHGVKQLKWIDGLLKSNVIIATPSVLSNFSNNCLTALLNACTHLIVDEAHHIAAKTWTNIKSHFLDKKIFQFTATPFRSDGIRVEGRIVFDYSLGKAQADGYFQEIEFYPVKEFMEEKADKAIYEKAVELLRRDIDMGFDHILMARASSIKRAEEIFELYKNEVDLKPLLINSKTKGSQEKLKAIKTGNHKIIVCVDMLGEGFDLANLKISAIHDVHKSINITLQFIGRFTRTSTDLGSAKFVANIANPNVNKELERLYVEDSDWNSIISEVSSEKIRDEKKYQNFKEKFSESTDIFNLGLTPNMSTTVYKLTLDSWNPQNIFALNEKHFRIFEHTTNDEKDTLIFNTKTYLPVGWTKSKELFNEIWDLYIIYYEKESGLLFFHTSNKGTFNRFIIKAIANRAVQLRGEPIFRALYGLKRLRLQNVGLNKHNKGLRYSMHTGRDIAEQIPDIEAQRAIKSNIFGIGFENGESTSIGCSYKGKIWAMDSDSIDKWFIWCKNVGSKILDESIDPNAILKTAMRNIGLSSFPINPILAVDWPIYLLKKSQDKVIIGNSDWKDNMTNCELSSNLLPNKDGTEIIIYLSTFEHKSEIRFSIQNDEVKFESLDNLYIQFGENKTFINDFFMEHPPIILLADTSYIEGDQYYYPSEQYAYLYNKSEIRAWNWEGVDISTESQKPEKLSNSIQYHTIQKIKDSYDLVFDDDGSGEVADIVAIKNDDDKTLYIDFYHLKYCSKNKAGISKPGARVDDIYQVAGQAAKSIKWVENVDKLISRLIDREIQRLGKGELSRIDKGELEDLYYFKQVAKLAYHEFNMTIIQPAISKERISDEQLIILGNAETYIKEITGIKLNVISSP
ncbi:DEAD/DEAH box helicase family protein [Psychrobacter sp. TAE2020]|uniref:DEAD/DEAH box helicase n=1 Tax=Psychrobacter sp. TAE2020 TaxID=2846762 RepID=UPI001C0FD480|nr:DEAD/DEAH box helicase family protein [Psychrobacter sp. TAE2020]MBU5617118.1 DEAD/DEAH box helicase family protein [Psychrobacter sp. TAE2020]